MTTDLNSMTHEELVALIQKLLAAVEASTGGEAAEAPAPEAAPEPEAPVVSELYGPYDEYWTQEFYPIKQAIDALRNSGNRYKEYLAQQLSAPNLQDGAAYKTRPADKARFLVKPVDGFVNAEHEEFFLKSWNGNRMKAHVIATPPGYASGHVYTEFKQSKWAGLFPWVVAGGTKYVEGAIQPFTANKGPEVARDLFETWWLSGAAYRAAYKRQGIVAAVKRIDSRYKFDGGNAEAEAKYRAMFPGWRPDDGSSEVLDI